MKVLHVAAEVFPLVKTGGLADVVGALPQALIELGTDVRLLLPGLPAIIDAVEGLETVCKVGPVFGAARVTLRLGRMPGSGVPVYVIDAPYLYRRDGGPYQTAAGVEWTDNAQRFALLGWIGAHLAAGELDADWAPQVLHAHDWHAAMACAYIDAHPATRTATVFTVHNLAYQGLFPSVEFPSLGLPARFMASTGLEYHSQLSFMKAGLKFALRVTTVSPTYAAEIATAEFGFGLDGVIRGRGAAVSGILNGVDSVVWDPARDAQLAATFSPARLDGKARCKEALQAELGLAQRPGAPLFGVVSRLTSQKGLDLVIGALPGLLRRGGQLALQGSGDPMLEAAFLAAAQAHPGHVAVRIGYDEALAHRIIAGCDGILVPSRFEPCGLTQLYGLRYGCVPIVGRTGGLSDTVIDANGAALAAKVATGIQFSPIDKHGFGQALRRAFRLFEDKPAWDSVQKAAMKSDVSWQSSASQYASLYKTLLNRVAVP